MFIVLLRFAENREKAGEYMPEHNAWLQRGFDQGSLLLAGSIKPSAGGCVLAHNIDREALEQFLETDPFVAQRVVTPEIIEVTPAKVQDQLSFLAPSN